VTLFLLLQAERERAGFKAREAELQGQMQV